MKFQFGFLGVLLALSSAAAAPVAVPFVGCPSDGQLGPQPGPAGRSVVLSIPSNVVAHLALYKSEYGGEVLAPRGWHCFGTYGSTGWTTVVAPRTLGPKDFFGKNAPRLVGPAIEVTLDDGGTSGRFGVARLIARYFPSRAAFLRRVISEGLEKYNDFPKGPYIDDHFVFHSRDMVEVVTPPGRNGMGTHNDLGPSDLPIHSVAIVAGGKDEDWTGVVVAVRLPKSQDDLAPVILKWAEQRYASEK